MSARPRSESKPEESKNVKKPVRVWVDGCFDMMHWGHANLCRQARLLGDILVAGVHSDAQVALNKGPPVMNEEERYAAVGACKWVDEVVRDAPYYTSMEVCEKYNIDIIIHGDDISVGADGTDTYAAARAAGKFRTVPRTIGVSSTDLVGRMLLLTKDHFVADENMDDKADMAKEFAEAPKTCVSKFVPSSRQIVQFSDRREPKVEDVVVYVDGGFDMFHIGHIKFLEEARKLGTYMIVGVLTDSEMNKIKGNNYPIMNIYERTLGVLSCRYVDEVIMGAPTVPTTQFLADMSVNIVVHGSQFESASETKYEGEDPYRFAKEAGLFRTVQSPSKLTTSDLVERIVAHRTAFIQRNRAKYQKEEKLLNEGADQK